jgi:hypothetical protein
MEWLMICSTPDVLLRALHGETLSILAQRGG